ncbi:MAG: hypothetical protein AABZ47_14785 [Planctomycetota bacterium]|mgnify:CR=1 FL=1
MKPCKCTFALFFTIGLSTAFAVPPTIHARWDNGGLLQPLESLNYEIVGTPDLPDVGLLTGRDDWRVWSLDVDNSTGDGDIGEISSPADDNFTLKLAAPGSPDKLMLFWGPYINFGLGGPPRFEVGER